MSTVREEPLNPREEHSSRRSFLQKVSVAGAIGAASLTGLLTVGSPRALGGSASEAADDDPHN